MTAITTSGPSLSLPTLMHPDNHVPAPTAPAVAVLNSGVLEKEEFLSSVDRGLRAIEAFLKVFISPVDNL